MSLFQKGQKACYVNSMQKEMFKKYFVQKSDQG